uniref:Phage protein n=1 Tax=Rhabditophanes sp. KR3021 TaxID=114890 RepID=A0AC35U2S9_9BILA
MNQLIIFAMTDDAITVLSTSPLEDYEVTISQFKDWDRQNFFKWISQDSSRTYNTVKSYESFLSEKLDDLLMIKKYVQRFVDNSNAKREMTFMDEVNGFVDYVEPEYKLVFPYSSAENADLSVNFDSDIPEELCYDEDSN